MAPKENASNGGQPLDDSLTPEQQAREKSAEEIMALGHQASHLLNNPVYNTVYALRLQQYFQAWLGTVPKEEKLRESLYYEARALINLTEDLGSLVSDAEDVLAEQQERHSPEGKARQHQREQGFGAMN